MTFLLDLSWITKFIGMCNYSEILNLFGPLGVWKIPEVFVTSFHADSWLYCWVCSSVYSCHVSPNGRSQHTSIPLPPPQILTNEQHFAQVSWDWDSLVWTEYKILDMYLTAAGFLQFRRRFCFLVIELHRDILRTFYGFKTDN